MGCVHTHRRMPTIKGWDGPNHIQCVVQKNGEDNQNDKKISRIVSQAHASKPEHDKIWAQLALDVLLESTLEKV